MDNDSKTDVVAGATTVRVRVSVSRPSGRYRAGRKWEGSTTADVTAAELAELKADPALAVVELAGGLDFDGLDLGELTTAAEAATAALDAALKAVDPSAGATLTVTAASQGAQEAHRKAQEGQRQAARNRSAGADAKAQEGPEGKPSGAPVPTLPTDLPFVELFKAAGKTPADVLALSRESKLATVKDVGPARAAEVQEWIDANPGKLSD